MFNLLKIGEFSKLTKVSVRMLHYYDEIGLLKPNKVDKLTGYRFYSIEQVPTLQKIILLRDLNFQVAEIDAVVNTWSEEGLIAKLEEKIVETNKHILIEQQKVENMRFTIDNIYKHRIDVHYNVVMKRIPSYKVISLRQVIPNHFDEGILWNKLYEYIKKHHIQIINQNDNNIAIYHDEDYREDGIDIEVCLLVKHLSQSMGELIFREIEAVDLMASMMVYGNYQNIAKAYELFVFWLEDHPQYDMYGMSRQICHRNCSNETKEENYLTEIQIPVRLKND